MDNRREHPRREVSIETRLFLRSVLRNEIPTILPCRIVDVSETGAKIQMDVRYRLPPRVFLLRSENENMYECRTVWQVDQAAGLAFVEVCGHGRHEELLKEIRIARIVDKSDQFDEDDLFDLS